MSTALAAPRPVPWDELDEFLHEEMVTCLRPSQQFMSAETFRKQCYYACDILGNHHHPAVPYSLIARIFGVAKPTIRGHCKKFLDHAAASPKNRHTVLLPEEAPEDLVRYISEAYQIHRPLILAQVRDYIEEVFHLSLDKTTVFHVLRQEVRLKSCHAILMEEERVDLTAEQIAESFASLIPAIDGVPAHFVLNMDEMDHQNWADRQVQTCYVPATVEEQQVHMPVCHAGKRIKLIGCIAADGSYLKAR
jgi:hypothetical protein